MGVDPRTSYLNGIFVVPITITIKNCLAAIQIGYNREAEGYRTSRYDMLNMDSAEHKYSVTLPQHDGELYFEMVGYAPR